MKRGAIVVYESTVYPGATEEVCVPVLELSSGLKWKADFSRRLLARAHQPRRQGAHRSTRIVKVVSGDDARVADVVASSTAR